MRWIGALGLFIGLPLGAEPKRDFARGVLEEARGEAGDEWFEQAREQDPEAWPLAGRVAGRRAAKGDIEGASTLYREFAAAHPERLEAQLEYVDFLRSSTPGDGLAAELAAGVLENALERRPGNLAVVRRLFRVYEERGLREKSQALFEQIGGVEEGGAAVAAVEMARTLFERDDPEGCTKVDGILRRAMARSPEDAVLARAASEHFRSTGRLDEAVRMLEKHAIAAPASLELRVRLGVLLLAAERFEEGEAALKEVLGIDPGAALAHQALAKLYRRRERWDEARAAAAEVLRKRGGDVGEFVELAQEFLDADLPRDARLLLEKGIFDHPESALLAVRLAIAARRDPSARATAARLFREAESLSAADGSAAEPEFLREFAECLLEAGETAAAEERLRTAIRTYGPEAKAETAAALRRLAGIWREEGRNEDAARALLQRAEMLAP